MAQKRSPLKPWAFLTYIAGDNNLSDFGLVDIREMCEEGASPALHVGVEIDTRGEHDGSIRYEVSEPDWTGEAHPTEIQRLPERDSGDPDVLKDFLKWGIGRYAANNYLVVVWNHGSGFRGVRRDIAYDDFGSSLDMPELAGALKAAGVSAANPIRILGFDACLMNMVEVVNQFYGLADIVVGSEQTEPGEGWPYNRVLAVVKAGTNPTAVAKGVVEAYINDYRKKHTPNVTQSAVDVKKTDAAIAALSKLGRLLTPLVPANRQRLREIRSRVQSYEFADYVDLIHLLSLIRQKIADSGVQAAAASAITAAANSIIAKDSYGAAVKNSGGLSVWYPPTQNLFHSYRGKYLALRFATTHRGWVEFLDAVYA